MKFKRLLTFALAATLSFSALTGCGTTNPDSTSAADTTKTDSSKTNITLGYCQSHMHWLCLRQKNF